VVSPIPRCCGGASCSCSIQAGPHITILGTGGPEDPFVISGDVDLEVTDTGTVDLTLSGAGTEAAPWSLSGRFSTSSKLNDLGDVSVSPSNGEVLAWNTSLGEWRAVAPTTAEAGSVSTDGSLTGDGSAGSPLQVREDSARLLATAPGGLGLSDAGINSTIRHFVDDTTRAAANPSPGLNTMSTLDSNPGELDYWTGSGWSPAGTFLLALDGDELYAMSGSYTGEQRITLMVRNIITTTDDLGTFEVVPTDALAGRAGVLSAQCTPSTGGLPLGSGVPWTVVLVGEGGALKGTAYRLDDGTAMPSTPVAASVLALLY
jgi:hypothetical protein